MFYQLIFKEINHINAVSFSFVRLCILKVFWFSDIILPVHEEHPLYFILGVLLCLRHIVPHFSQAMLMPTTKANVSVMQNDEELVITKDQLLKVCIF